MSLLLTSCTWSETSADRQSIVVFGATGVIGQAIVVEALERGHLVTGVSRSPEKFQYSQPNFTPAAGNPTDAQSVAELVDGVDAIIIAVGARTATRPEETAMNQTAIAVSQALAEAGSSGPQVVIIGGGMTMRGSRENMIKHMPPHAPQGSAMYALFLGHWEAYETYMASNINWTFLAPPMNILGFGRGANDQPNERTGGYRTSTEQSVVSADGKNQISMADLAVAALDFAEQPKFNQVKVTVGY
nr:uncharacterized protein YwnB-like [Nerophis lumbriciformis]